jgi:UDP-glucose 4-epimerase
VKALVTGGAGFIGSHVVDRLEAAGHEPRIFDLAPSHYHSSTDVDTVTGDLLDADSLRRAMVGVDAVIHLAAVADVNEVDADPAYAEAVNTRGTFNVLEAAATEGVGHVIYGSTIWVYDGHVGVADEDTPVAAPGHLYTATKLAGEMYCRAHSRRHGLATTVLRFGIPFGPRSRQAAVVAAFVKRALAGEPLTIAGDGSQSRRFVYVEDLAEGVVAALDPVARDRTYNLVGTESVTVRRIADVVRSLIGNVDIMHVEKRAGDFTGAEVSASRAAADLDWVAGTPFVEGVRRYIDWLRARDGAVEAGSVG